MVFNCVETGLVQPPHRRDRPGNAIEGPKIRKALLPIWLGKPGPARRVRQRIGAVLDWAWVNGFRARNVAMRSPSEGLPGQPKEPFCRYP